MLHPRRHPAKQFVSDRRPQLDTETHSGVAATWHAFAYILHLAYHDLPAVFVPLFRPVRQLYMPVTRHRVVECVPLLHRATHALCPLKPSEQLAADQNLFVLLVHTATKARKTLA